MELWKVHPKYLDNASLKTCWNQGLLAQEIMFKSSTPVNSTLEKFYRSPNYRVCLEIYLFYIFIESEKMNMAFDLCEIKQCEAHLKHKNIGVVVDKKVLEKEFDKLMQRLYKRDWEKFKENCRMKAEEKEILPNPVFRVEE